MSSIGTGYDLSASQFSPDGRVFQVEYAHKAVENSGTVIGLRGKDGVVFAVEKLVTSKLYEPGANRRIFNIDRNIGMAVSGLISDARQIVETARTEASNYRAQYGYGIPLKYLNDRVSMYMHAYTLYSAVRPFGCSVIIGTYEEDGPTMFMIDPSGVSYGYHACTMGKAKKAAKYQIEKLCMPQMTVARTVPKHVHDVDVTVSVILQGYYGCAVGKAKQAAKTEIEKLKLADMSLKDMVKEAARIIYMVHDELKDKQFELELSWVGAQTNGLFSRVPEAVFHEAEKFAKTAMEDDSDSDTEDM